MTLPLKNVLLGLASAALLANPASAQTQSSTPVIGYYKFQAPSGTSTWTCAFVTKKEFQGAMTGFVVNAGKGTISVAGTPLTASAYTSHYIEILSGPNTGLILDVETTPANTTSQITVAWDPVGNTTALTGNETFCVRKHAKLSTVFASGGGLAPIDDSVEIVDPNGNTILAIWDGSAWVDGVDFVTPRDPILYPAQGFKINSLSGSTVTFGGAEVSYVKTGPTIIPVYAGMVNLVGIMDPVVPLNPSAPDYATSSAPLSSLGLNTLAPIDDIVTLFTAEGTLTESLVVWDGTQIVDGVDYVTPKGSVTVTNGSAIQISPLSTGVYVQPASIPSGL
jgi:hypothetical protein